MLTPPHEETSGLAPAPRQFGAYTLETNRRVGCTQLMPGVTFDSAACPRAVAGKLVAAEDKAAFLQHEGLALMLVSGARPHPALPALLASTDLPDGSGLVVFDRPGEDLHSYVRSRGRLPETEARALFAQVAGGVAHCHALRVVLRDIKLGKLFFKRGGDRGDAVVFGDLDGARVVSLEDPLMHDQKGSPAYVSPEVLSFQPYDGAAADVWALGVVLYVMLTGMYPFQDTNPTGLFRRIQCGAAAVKFPEYLSPRAVALVSRLLHRDPVARPAAQDILADPWFQPDSPCTQRRRARAAAAAARSPSPSPPASPAAVDADPAWAPHKAPTVAELHADFVVPQAGFALALTRAAEPLAARCRQRQQQQQQHQIQQDDQVEEQQQHHQRQPRHQHYQADQDHVDEGLWELPARDLPSPAPLPSPLGLLPPAHGTKRPAEPLDPELLRPHRRRRISLLAAAAAAS